MDDHFVFIARYTVANGVVLVSIVSGDGVGSN